MGLSKEQVDQFNRRGYLVAKGLVGKELIRDVVAEYEARLAGVINGWADEGLIDRTAADLPFNEQLLASYEAGLDYFQPLDISLPPEGITQETPMHAGPAIFSIMVSDGILDAVESLIGPEILSNPIQHVRIKPPAKALSADERRSHVTYTAWHQDRGVATEEADRTHMVTVWLAVTDANVDNGCLRVLPDTKDGPLLGHCPQPQMGIPDSMVDGEGSLPLEVESGDAVIFHPLTIHGAGMNTSDRIRWSFDLRYSRIGEPTGRPLFPKFVARSRKDPSSELRDPAEWARMWGATRDRLSGATGLEFHRWSQDAPICA